jgi:hypothetical protein
MSNNSQPHFFEPSRHAIRSTLRASILDRLPAIPKDWVSLSASRVFDIADTGAAIGGTSARTSAARFAGPSATSTRASIGAR